MRGLSGLRILVTGAAQGIGRATCLRFAQEGARVAVNDLDAGLVAETVAGLPPVAAGTHLAVLGSVAEEAEVETMVSNAVATFGGLDVLVNNAGIVLAAPTEQMDMAVFDRVMAVNLRGVVLCARAAIRHFLATGTRGLVLNTSSVHDLIPKPGFLGYAASKAAVGHVTRTLALEYADRGIRVNAVAPGATITPMNAGWKDDPTQRPLVEAHIPLGRAGEAAEIAGVFAFLASEDASYITGQTFYVDGGITLYNDFRTNWST